ncbi:MAG: hypothetical protein HY901_27530 [Deltaproteobacteria bacterium]|nr:hypothetical protein [Deltaproteobacteria bacterium]
MLRTFAAAAFLTALAFPACGSIDAAVDCHSICSRYSDCYDADYDVGACESRCRDHSSDDADYRHLADQCNACISDRACPAASFNCATECLSVVP